ncbi:MAG: hypothetical protein CL897_03680 [Dehalococcoidia bacterium]|mgnify:CR=1 FL=1|nr:hypothetical protein [Dehalococcoidia bacterium]
MRGKGRVPLRRSANLNSGVFSDKENRMAVTIGEPAPAFTLMNRDREELTLDSFPGQHIILAFYPLAFTGG